MAGSPLLSELPKGLGARRLGRILTLAVLYEVDTSKHPWPEALDNALDGDRYPRVAEEFAHELMTGITAHQAEIDTELQRHAPEFPLAQLSAIDRNILRIAIHEILFDNKTPPKAVVNEAIELAKTFGSENLHRFVNGVLGSVLESATPLKQTNPGGHRGHSL